MLIGNPVDFDRIRARYEALRYPTPEEASFNAARASYEGLLTGSGFDTQMVPTTTPGQQVSFSVDPIFFDPLLSSRTLSSSLCTGDIS